MAIKYSCAFSGINEIALTLVDIFNGIDEIKVCVDYLDKDGNSVDFSNHNLSEVEPVLKEFEVWHEDYTKVKTFDDFSENFKKFVYFVEEYLGIRISIVSFGKNRDEILER